jgi:hypothetical protein
MAQPRTPRWKALIAEMEPLEKLEAESAGKRVAVANMSEGQKERLTQLRMTAAICEALYVVAQQIQDAK